MELKFVKDLELSWPLQYRENSTKELAGIKIKIENPPAIMPLSKHGQKNNSIYLLSSLLLKVNENFNLVSLEGSYNNNVSATINLAKPKTANFIEQLNQIFEAMTKKFSNKAKLNFEEGVLAKHYHISDGLFIFELIKGLSNRLNLHRKGAYTKKITGYNLVEISSGETRQHTSFLELALKCGGAYDFSLNRIRWLIRNFARQHSLSVI